MFTACHLCLSTLMSEGCLLGNEGVAQLVVHDVWTLLSGFKFQMVGLPTHLEGNCMSLDRQRPKAE